MAHRYGTKPNSKPKKKMLDPSNPHSHAGRPPVLLPEQVNAVLTWIAEGLTSGQINNRAANFDPAFTISPQSVYSYRKSREIDINTLRQQRELLALNTGLAVKANRVEALQRLAQTLEDDIDLRKRMWLERMKSIPIGDGQYKVLTELEFIGNLPQQLRGVYADIAAETGGRVVRTDVTSNGKSLSWKEFISASKK